MNEARTSLAPEWTKILLLTLDIRSDDSPSVVLKKAEELANRLAPDARVAWNWVTSLQGIAVLAPFLWLLFYSDAAKLLMAAISVTACTVLVVGICWWLRWRGMQHAWARSRVLAEIARSAAVTMDIAPGITWRSLFSSPELSELAKGLFPTHQVSTTASLEVLKGTYLEQRVEDQLSYYRKQQEQARSERRELGRIVTISLDVALFLAIAGLVIAFSSNATQWFEWSGSVYVLSIVGSLLPLTAILAQLKGAHLELNRRVGRYAQQVNLLENCRSRLADANDLQELVELVQGIEESLLAEVVEWYHLTEQSASYYRGRQDVGDEKTVANAADTGERGMFSHAMSGIGIALAFVGRVVFGRLLVAAAAVVLTTMLINYQSVRDDPVTSATLRSIDGQLWTRSDGGYTLWNGTTDRDTSGFLLISHGLRGSFVEDPWMKQMGDAVVARTGSQASRVVFVDWHDAARPSDQERSVQNLPLDMLGLAPELAEMLGDVSAIRPSGEQIGELVGFKLARAIRRGTLDRSMPFHFVGHSAGGFVVLRAATVLADLGLAPSNLRITLLDTPLPLAEEIARASAIYKVDAYITSPLGIGNPENGFDGQYQRTDIDVPASIVNPADQHRYAYEWYLGTMRSSDATTGFTLSPLLDPN